MRQVNRPRRALIIANPAAGQMSDAVAGELLALCRRHIATVELRPTRAGGGTSALLRGAFETDPPDVVLAAGGDGTAGEVAAALAGAGDAPMLIIPFGSANSCYRALWHDRPWRETVTAALSGGATVRRLDLIRVVETDALALVGVGSGLNPVAVAAARAAKELGRARYESVIADVVARFRPYRGVVAVDDEVIHDGDTVAVYVGGGRYRGGQFDFLPQSVLDDGLLDVCLITAETRASDVAGLARAGRIADAPGVRRARGKRVRIERTDGLPLDFEHDGEVITGERRSFTVEVVPGAAAVLTPP
jgi:diacylglycerol kinase (ATP)